MILVLYSWLVFQNMTIFPRICGDLKSNLTAISTNKVYVALLDPSGCCAMLSRRHQTWL